MDEVTLIAGEIGRIVRAPYAPSLTRLHGILVTVQPHSVRCWANGNACQIDTLAAAVLQEVERWPYALDVVRILSNAKSFRDALLRQKPSLLPALLEKALHSSTEGSPSHVQTSVALLSHPFPEDCVLPANFPAFLSFVLDNAAENPSSESIRPLHSIVKGVGVDALEIIPSPKILHLQGQLIKILGGLEDPTANLLCLSIFARFAKSSASARNDSSSEAYSSRLEPGTPEIYGSAKKFFGTKKASKTLKFVVLQAIRSCSNDFDNKSSQAVENLNLAREIIETVDVSEKNLWVLANEGIVQKFYGKLLRPDFKVEGKLPAFEVVASLVTVASLPGEVIGALENILQLPALLVDTARVTRSYLCRFSKSFILAQFLRLIDVSQYLIFNGDPCGSVFDNMRSFGSCLSEAFKTLPMIKDIISLLLSPSSVHQDAICQFVSDDPQRFTRTTSKHEDTTICSLQAAKRALTLQQDICHLLLESAIFAVGGNNTIDTALTSRILRKSLSLRVQLPQCKSNVACQAVIFSVPKIEVKPETVPINQGWKICLREQLKQNSTSQLENIIRMTDDICRELEDRCSGVEHPLREERQKSAEVMEELEIYQQKCKELEGKFYECNLKMDGLEAERAQLVRQVQGCEERLETYAVNLEKAHKQRDEAKREAMDIARTVRETVDQERLDHHASLAARDEHIEEQGSRITVLDKHLAEAKEDFRSTAQENLRLKVMLEERQMSLETSTESGSKLAIQVEQLRLSELDLTAQKEMLKSQLEDLQLRVELESCESARKVADFKEIVSQAKAVYEQRIWGLEEKSVKQEAEDKQVITALEDRLAKSVIETNSAAKLHNDETAGLTSKIERLQKELRERAKEFVEVQDFGKRFMALMGSRTGKGTNAFTEVGFESDPTRSFDELSKDNHREVDNREEAYQAFESTASDKSSPISKQLRTRRSHETPDSHSEKSLTESVSKQNTRTTTLRPVRRPFRSVGPNMQITDMPNLRKPNRSYLKIPKYNDTTRFRDENYAPFVSQDVGDISLGETEIHYEH